ncbi:MAG: WecB/TagA/CpsF family glycosyltransferase [Candidatus Falkowbacteria bacterium]|nr:WecB/TagA/CpsF family glycosyltransferase [Candidatus Falkowbacteria bacterium]
MVNILGINLSALNRGATLEKIGEFLSDGRQHYLVTPNPEIILKSHQDEELFYILNKADLSLADGFGIKLAGFIAGKKIPRLTGADLTLDLLALAGEKKLRVAVLNREGGLSQQTAIKDALTKKYPELETLVIDHHRHQPLSHELLEKINAFAPMIFFNTFGSPYQEKIIYHNLAKMPSVKVAIGVGGAFDFITGKIKRAPKAMRVIGLEWLWRLVQQPKRIKRIYNATVVFTVTLFRSKFNHFFYRPCVACFLYKKGNDETEVLIVEREDDPGHWQLPQGGTDGESLAKAGARELREELNTDKFVMKAVFKRTYSYLFPPVSQQSPLSLQRRFIFDYKGQRQGLFIAEFFGRNEDIKVNFWDHSDWRWVDIHDLVASVHERRREATQIFLAKFKSLK